MSTILDALKKAGSEQGHVRAPIAQGQLYAQTQLQQRAPAPPGSGSGSAMTAVLAVGALILTATVFIVIVFWVSRAAGQQQMASPAPGPSPAPSPPPATPVEVAPVAVVSSVDLAPPQERSPRGLRYLDAQRLPVVPIEDLSAALPPPDLAMVEDLAERDWSDMIDEEEIFEEETPAEPQIAQPRHRLDGVIWDEVNPLAIINGNIAGPGDQVEGAQISRIESDRVVLVVDGEEVTLRY